MDNTSLDKDNPPNVENTTNLDLGTCAILLLEEGIVAGSDAIVQTMIQFIKGGNQYA